MYASALQTNMSCRVDSIKVNNKQVRTSLNRKKDSNKNNILMMFKKVIFNDFESMLLQKVGDPRKKFHYCFENFAVSCVNMFQTGLVSTFQVASVPSKNLLIFFC